MNDPDPMLLLTSDQVGPLLAATLRHAGGKLVSWALDQIDQNPGHSTIATYAAKVDWPYGQRNEVLGVAARVDGLNDIDKTGEVFADGDRQVSVWLYPKDPDLPGLARAAYAESMAELCNSHHIFPTAVKAEQLLLQMIGYRPRRRAVIKVTNRSTGESVYVKVLRPHLSEQVISRHQLLAEAGIPVAEIRAVTDDHLLILAELGGTPLTQAIFNPLTPCTATDLMELLDRLPAGVSALPRRAPWAESLRHYASVITASMPKLYGRLEQLTGTIEELLADSELGDEPTHGDFHEGQLHVQSGKLVGILDVDTLGPGSRADDLACLVAHLSTIQRMNAVQTERVHQLIRDWVPEFDKRVNPQELRLRAAAVVVSLATGPFRSQEPDWERETSVMIGSAEALVRQVS